MLQIKATTKVWLCPTDTIYGLSARASDTEAIERVRQIKGRGSAMGFIVLVPSIESLAEFGVVLTESQRDFLSKVWPGKVSVVFGPVAEEYRHLGGDFESVAFRMPEHQELLELLKEVGPITSTSANRHGESPVTTVAQAKEVFGNEVDEYIDGGELAGAASVLVKVLR